MILSCKACWRADGSRNTVHFCFSSPLFFYSSVDVSEGAVTYTCICIVYIANNHCACICKYIYIYIQYTYFHLGPCIHIPTYISILQTTTLFVYKNALQVRRDAKETNLPTAARKGQRTSSVGLGAQSAGKQTYGKWHHFQSVYTLKNSTWILERMLWKRFGVYRIKLCFLFFEGPLKKSIMMRYCLMDLPSVSSQKFYHNPWFIYSSSIMPWSKNCDLAYNPPPFSKTHSFPIRFA